MHDTVQTPSLIRRHFSINSFYLLYANRRLSMTANGVGTNFGVAVGEVSPEGPRVVGWGSWGGDIQPIPTNYGFAGAL